VATSTTAPKTSPVMPPKRRVQRQPSATAEYDDGERGCLERADATRDQRAESARTRGGDAAQRGVHDGQASSRSRYGERGRSAPQVTARRGGKCRDVDEQDRHDRGDAEGADVGLLHDRECPIGRRAAAEPIGGVRQAVEMQPPGEQLQRADAQGCGEQGGTLGTRQHDRGHQPGDPAEPGTDERQPTQRRSCPQLGVRVPAERHGDDREHRDRRPQA
jgi:hypothetical protein